jgi:mannosyltransferase
MTVNYKKPEILIDNIVFALQKSGGISVVWYEILQRLLIDTEIDFHMIDLPNQNIFRKNLTIPIEVLCENNLSGYPLNVQRYLNPKTDGKGIFHSSYYRTSSSRNFVNITTVHDFTYEYFRAGIPRLIHQFQKSQAIKNSKKIICVSQNTKTDLMRFFPSISQENIKVIYNGVDSIYQPIQKEETQIQEICPFSSGEYLLFVGERKSPHKNFNMVVNACKITNHPLVMVGGGPINENENQLLLDELGQNRFKLLSGINNEQLNLLYNHALCLLYPSLYEGFGIPVLEAQKAGCPVISTNKSSIPEVAGRGAILLDKVTEFQIADAVKLLENNLIFTNNLIQKGHQNAERFSWDKCYLETKQLYKEVYEEYF